MLNKNLQNAPIKQRLFKPYTEEVGLLFIKSKQLMLTDEQIISLAGI